MFFSKEKDQTRRSITGFVSNKALQRGAVALATLFISFGFILNGATPEKYKMHVNEVSSSNINAPREIENKTLTEENAEAEAKAIPATMIEKKGAAIDVINNADNFITSIESARAGVIKSLEDQGINKKSKNYKKQLTVEQDVATAGLSKSIEAAGVNLSIEQVRYLVSKASDQDITDFKNVTRDLISNAMKQDITEDNLEKQIVSLQNSFQVSEMSQDLKIIGGQMTKTFLKANKVQDDQLTKEKRDKAYTDAVTNKKVIIKKDDRIISAGEVLTFDKFQVLKDLNLIEENKFDFVLAGGILGVLILLAALLILYMNYFHRKILSSRNDVILISAVILLTVIVSRWTSEYSALAIPIFMAPMLISILLDLKLAIVVNLVLTIAISFVTNGDLTFIYMSLISGTFSAFFVSKAHQRSRLLMTGVMAAVINVLIIVSVGVINRIEVSRILSNSEVVALNGIISIVLTIGTLPFWESVFNIITPMKLLEMASPNQPLIKRLLMEAPGTYHHSLMVGNLAEVACDAIGGNSLLARVGAYFHDIGKLKRPNFFKENQLSDNPHDRMTANLSTLVITSHTRDGLELALKHKVPLAIREIVSQHHGTTLVAYFYHKAKKGDKGDEVKPENFRYEGPKPTSKEAAVVMLADSVEAAVRSMIDKTEGKIEGLVRKIIKEKLDDGQLDQCSLTLKDLDDVAKGFMKVFSGFFHEREEYPEIKQRETVQEDTVQDIPAAQETQGESSQASAASPSASSSPVLGKGEMNDVSIH